MKKGKTKIQIILDRSGSMHSIRNDMEGGLDAFIKKQTEEPGECEVSLTQFDDKQEIVFENVEVKKVAPIKLVPRNGTALNDAMGSTISCLGESLAKLSESERPETVIVLVVTDGEENSSKEYSIQRVKEMVEHQKTKYNWQFIFLGANIDAVQVGQSYGFDKGKSMTYAAKGKNVRYAGNVLANMTASIRKGVDMNFSDEERIGATE